MSQPLLVQPLDVDEAAAIQKDGALHGGAKLLVVDAEVAEVVEALSQLEDGENVREALETLIQAMSPDVREDVLIDMDQVERNVDARVRFLLDYRAYDTAGLQQALALRHLIDPTVDGIAAVQRLVAEGSIFAVTYNGEFYFPAFQFDDSGEPKPVVGCALRAMSGTPLDDWARALWFTSPNAWLDMNSPIELLDKDPEAVVGAASGQFSSRLGF